LLKNDTDFIIKNKSKPFKLLFIGSTYFIIEAVRINKIEIVKLLIESGVDINVETTLKENAMYIAAYHNYVEIAKLLIASGFDVKAKDYLYSAVKGKGDEVITILIEAGADVNATFNNTSNVLCKAYLDKNRTAIKVLTKNGANIRKLFSYVVVKRSKDGILMLLELSKELEIDIINYKCNCHGKTPLITSILENTEEIVELLIKEGADVNITDNIGASPAWIASSMGYVNILKLLLDAGADMEKHSNDKFTPMVIAIGKNKFESVKFLVENKVKVDPYSLLAAVQINNIEMVKFLLPLTNVNFQDPNKKTAIMFATYEDNVDITKLLIENGADVNMKDKLDWSAVHFAARNNSFRALSLMIEAGADINVKNTSGNTPLSIATRFYHHESVNLLLKCNNPKNSMLIKTCIVCCNQSNNNILSYVNMDCPVCYTEQDCVFVFNCGHFNCCVDCFNKIN
jgi:ankyrin repeat protein